MLTVTSCSRFCIKLTHLDQWAVLKPVMSGSFFCQHFFFRLVIITQRIRRRVFLVSTVDTCSICIVFIGYHVRDRNCENKILKCLARISWWYAIACRLFLITFLELTEVLIVMLTILLLSCPWFQLNLRKFAEVLMTTHLY